MPIAVEFNIFSEMSYLNSIAVFLSGDTNNTILCIEGFNVNDMNTVDVLTPLLFTDNGVRIQSLVNWNHFWFLM